MMMTRTPPWGHNDHSNSMVLVPTTAEKTTVTASATPLRYSPEIYPDSPASCCTDDSDSEAVLLASSPGDTEEEECSSSSSLEPASKIPCYIGTIYEARLAPLSPFTTLSDRRTDTTTSIGGGHHRRANSAAQARLLGLVEARKEAELEAFLEDNSHLVDMNQYGEDGVTPLQRVCQEGGPVGVARLLVRYGADVRMTSRDGWSPLHMAAYSGSSQLLMYLLKCPK